MKLTNEQLKEQILILLKENGQMARGEMSLAMTNNKYAFGAGTYAADVLNALEAEGIVKSDRFIAGQYRRTTKFYCLPDYDFVIPDLPPAKTYNKVGRPKNIEKHQRVITSEEMLFNEITGSMNSFFVTKKKEMMKEVLENSIKIESDLQYYRNLATEYKDKIDVLESEAARAKLKF